MQTNTTEQTRVEQPEPQTAVEDTVMPAAPTVEEVLQRIREDAVVNPRRYAEEVDVPGGGE